MFGNVADFSWDGGRTGQITSDTTLMRRAAHLRVECFAEVLRPHLKRVSELDSGFAESTRKTEDGLSQGLKSVSLFHPLFIGVLFLVVAFGGRSVFAQESDSSVNSRTPSAVPKQQDGDEQLRLMLQQGKAETAILDWVLANSGPVKGDTHAGGMRVAFTVTPAEGWWDKAGGGKLAWHDAPANNVHLRIFLLDLADGRLLSGLSLRATFIDANGNEQSVPVDFGWYPLINAYGGNVPLAADGRYTLRVAVEGRSPRPDRVTIAEFAPVQIAQDAVSALPLATAIDFAKEPELLKPCNAALSATITALWQQSASGLEERSDDYFVGYALGGPGTDGAFESRLKTFSFRKSETPFSLLIRDSRTGRFLPTLSPQANFIVPDGKSLGPGELFPTSHPWLNHYGQKVRISRKGVYKLHVHFEAPAFRRWGHQTERFAASADVEFDGVSLNPPRPAPKKAEEKD